MDNKWALLNLGVHHLDPVILPHQHLHLDLRVILANIPIGTNKELNNRSLTIRVFSLCLRDEKTLPLLLVGIGVMLFKLSKLSVRLRPKAVDIAIQRIDDIQIKELTTCQVKIFLTRSR